MRGDDRSGIRGLRTSSYRQLRATARRSGLGRLRTRIQASVNESPLWTAVPPRRLKDLDAGGVLARGAIALTFDDGPDPEATPRLLELLESHMAKATFFMCGLAASRHPDIVKAVVAAGHSVGGHSWDHRHRLFRGLAPTEWQRQIGDTHELLTTLTGAPVRWFRPPRGITDSRTWRTLRRQGVTTVLWSVDGRDCTLRDPALIAARVLDKLNPGAIALLHDSNANFLFSTNRPRYGEVGSQESTVRATDIIIRGARERGLQLVPLDLMPGRLMPRTGRPRVMTARGVSPTAVR
jgi:peptidoglycan-N-acetylglucosamine deacetylase